MKFFALSISTTKDQWTSQVIEASDESEATETVQKSLPMGWVVITVAPTATPSNGILFSGVRVSPFLPDLSI